uniref:Uncharacterized protein n=1 Tax=Pediastrum duplex TaxID=3105 RepID=A0A1W5RMN3_PEDDU|nr:hypothetical protein [Pediastrum duplex]YP_009364102.1 hypothetical protein [Pediastrum duplex]AQU64467.1 hypothetical protein [Pediastrum duplex]AQU64468.1 hypothetical protein [Pediastrum duplex]
MLPRCFSLSLRFFAAFASVLRSSAPLLSRLRFFRFGEADAKVADAKKRKAPPKRRKLSGRLPSRLRFFRFGEADAKVADAKKRKAPPKRKKRKKRKKKRIADARRSE